MFAYSNQDIEPILSQQRDFFATGMTKSVPFRKMALHKLYDAMVRHEDYIEAALRADLNKSPMESQMTEIGMVRTEIRFVLKNLSVWASRKFLPTPLYQMPGWSFSMQEPYGNVLILSPWNYPFQLNLIPLVDALAAGNCVILKPSEHAPQTAEVVKTVLAECFPPKYVAVISGGQEESEQLLEQKFDFIFFTGSQQVGKRVMEQAAKHLTPVCLELGGKSPCIVDNSADLKVAARRIAFGKMLNAGQTCVAPDYVLVQDKVKDLFLGYLQYYFKRFLRSPDDYPQIVNQTHFERLVNLMENGSIAYGGVCNAQTLQISPTILSPVSMDSPVMEEEIFGPILPVIPFSQFQDAVTFIKARPKPLALYLFTKNRLNEACVLNRLSFGSGCINDTMVHLSSPYLGFGGVGASGMGRYHGKAGFETFSHQKNILKKTNRLDIPLRYPPYGKLKEFLIRQILG